MRRLEELEEKYGSFLRRAKIQVTSAIIPTEWVAGTRKYLEQLVYQISACYESGLYDGCAVLSRRLMESLIIEIYIHQKRQHEIQEDGRFVMLDRLISRVRSDPKVTLGRNSPGTMDEIKQLGDTAAHDRTYITPQVDINDVKTRYRRLINELLEKAGITK